MTSRAVVQQRTFGALRWVVIAFLALVTAFPFFYMLLLSVTPIGVLLQDPGRLWPSDIDLSSYREVLRPVSDGGQGFPALMLNSLIVAVATVLLTLVFSVLGAYALARIRFRGRAQLGTAFLAVYLFPAVVLAGPLYVAFARLGLTSSLAGLVIVYVALTLPISVHMLRGHFESIPVSIEEAAAIDGCGRFGLLWRVTLPLSVPAIMSTGLYIFMIAWNEFLFALLFLTGDRDDWTVSLGLSQLTSGVEVPKTVLMAGSVLLTLPIVALYSIAERTLADGATAGAVKG